MSVIKLNFLIKKFIFEFIYVLGNPGYNDENARQMRREFELNKKKVKEEND